ncbi:MAG: bifunctional hexulose-6-phosphate synthase/ribonuclease regulator [Planctomycetes bacterium]|nr:bifunctional hexulose-6-phosphate synthase/ribonuclease regulator [Planctomycetota bacterium]
MSPRLQIALDFVDLSRAMKAAREAVAGGADWLEAGTPLIKSEGLDAVRQLRKEFPRHTIVADMKTMDAGRIEMEAAAKAGANVAVVMGAASNSTIEECVRAGRNFGIEVGVDLLGVKNAAGRAEEVAKLGVSHVGVHAAIDEQMKGQDPFERLRAVAQAVDCPVAVAGGINSETAADAVNAGASIVIVGGAVTKSADAKKATAEIKRAIAENVKVKTDLYKRVSEEGVREVFERTTAADISHANHNMPGLSGIVPVNLGVKMVGRAVTVRTYPGDWAKPVEAIDVAEQGSVVVIDAGGVPPAVWGELATNSSIQKKLAGVVIHGAIRDTGHIRGLKFPAFARCIVPHCGEPKGFGEIGVPVTIAGVRVNPGDWVIGDDDGVVVVPKEQAAEMANRAMDTLEAENRILGEIKAGKTTLGQVVELMKWEKK